MLNPNVLEQALGVLGELLAARSSRYDIVVAGGSGLLLLGFIQRATKDVDIVGLWTESGIVSAEPLPVDLLEAIHDVAEALGLQPDWLNPGPTELLRFGLPAGFETRVSVRNYGGLHVLLVGRYDQICLKLYAVVDQGPHSKHADDLQRLVPAPEELLEAARWAMSHDPSEAFRSELLGALQFFGVDDADQRL